MGAGHKAGAWVEGEQEMKTKIETSLHIALPSAVAFKYWSQKDHKCIRLAIQTNDGDDVSYNRLTLDFSQFTVDGYVIPETAVKLHPQAAIDVVESPVRLDYQVAITAKLRHALLCGELLPVYVSSPSMKQGDGRYAMAVICANSGRTVIETEGVFRCSYHGSVVLDGLV